MTNTSSEKDLGCRDFLNDSSKKHFERVCSLLQSINIPFEINHRLVRGLDYYNNTVFEITANELGAQNSLGGGGRYDGLIGTTRRTRSPCNRIWRRLRADYPNDARAKSIHSPPRYLLDLFLIPLGEEAASHCLKLVCFLRERHLKVEMDFSGKKLKGAMRYADAIKAHYVAVIGDQELASGQIDLKEMATGSLKKIPIDRLAHELQKNTSV